MVNKTLSVKQIRKTSVELDFSVEDLQHIVMEHLKNTGMDTDNISKITVDGCYEDDMSAWSGQRWDDGPLPQIFTGLRVKIFYKDEQA